MTLKKCPLASQQASGCHLIQCEILIPLIDPQRIINGGRHDDYVYSMMNRQPEDAVEPPPDVSVNR